MTSGADNLIRRAAAVRLIVMDVDGVLTDGRITYGSDDVELKSFNVKDGLGISLAVREGYQLGIITARESAMVARRAAELGIQHLVQKTRTKRPAFEQLAADLGLSLSHVAYIGDDLPDIPCLEIAGLPACPADAATEVKAACALVSNHQGGAGAVREIIEFILECRGLFPPSEDVPAAPV
jgi:3-deoxy-D-manno-octulosonate 8-phosphate phosphatase (KDO 8-P phosphatase)